MLEPPVAVAFAYSISPRSLDEPPDSLGQSFSEPLLVLQEMFYRVDLALEHFDVRFVVYHLVLEAPNLFLKGLDALILSSVVIFNINKEYQ